MNGTSYGDTALEETPYSDIVDGRIKPDASPAQLYDLEADCSQPLQPLP